MRQGNKIVCVLRKKEKKMNACYICSKKFTQMHIDKYVHFCNKK